MKIKLSDYVIRFIAEKGVKHIFYLPGGGAMHLVDSLGKCKDVEPICMLHEQSVSIAAESYAMHTNNLGVGLVTTGPGGTNAITGTVAAWIDSIPCLFVSGQVKRADIMKGKGIRQFGIQEVDIVAMVQSITKYAITVTEPEMIRYHLEKAVYLAQHGRKGPVWLDIPLDVQGSLIEDSDLKGFDSKELKEKPIDTGLLSKNIKSIIELLNNAERPVIIAGDGIKLSNSEDLFYELIDLLEIPIIPTWKAMDILHEEHHLFAGRGGLLGERSANFTMQNSDLLFCLGSRMDYTQTGFDIKSFARVAKKIVVDIDENEIKKLTFPIDLPIISDVKLVLIELLAEKKNILNKNRNSWKEKVKEWRIKYPIIKKEYYNKTGLVNPYVLVDMISKAATKDDIINPCCAGTAAEYVFQSFKIKEDQKFITNHGLGPMGFELPGSIGSSLANNRSKTICIAGDGGIQLNIQELATLQRLNLPIKIFVMNNNGYSSIRTMQEVHFNGNNVGNDPESGLSLPDIVEIAKAYKLKAIRINDARELEAKINEVLQYDGPVICDVLVIPDFKVAPKVSSKRREDGSMVSKPLEDQWPFLDKDELLSNMMIPLIEE